MTSNFSQIYLLGLLLVSGSLYALPAVADCNSAKIEAMETLDDMLRKKLKYEAAQFREAKIVAWREKFGSPALLALQLQDAINAIASARPLAELAETEYEEAAHKVVIACGQTDGG